MSHVRDRRAYKRGWVAVITGPDGKEDHSRSFGTEREAKNYITKHEAAKLEERFVSPKAGNVSFAQRWLDTSAQEGADLRPSSLARDESYVVNQILPYLGPIRLRDIDHDTLQNWVHKLSALGYAPATVHKAHAIVSKVLKAAVAQRLIFENPCQHTKLPPLVQAEHVFLDLDEVDSLVAAIDPRFALASRLAAFTGLRAGELFGLQVRDLDLDDNWLSVSRTIVEVRGHLHFQGFGKTPAASRDVPIPEIIADELAAHVRGLGRSELVFPAVEGGPVRLSMWRRRYWYPATCAEGVGLGEMVPCAAFDAEGKRRPSAEGKLSGCPHCKRPPANPRGPHYVGMRLHDLRHTAASFWIAEGRSMFYIAAYLGHTNTALVDRIYGHLKPKVHDETQAKINEKLARRQRRAGGDNVTKIPRRRAG